MGITFDGKLFNDQQSFDLPNDKSGTIALLSDITGGSASYLVYTALLTQTGTDAPVATVLDNTLGGTVVWSRIGVGDYLATIAGAFTLNKTVCPPFGTGLIAMMPLSNSDVLQYAYTMGRDSADTVGLQVYAAVDYSNVDLSTAIVTNKLFIEIRVYP